VAFAPLFYFIFFFGICHASKTNSDKGQECIDGTAVAICLRRLSAFALRNIIHPKRRTMNDG